jgi:hypothetical protein
METLGCYGQSYAKNAEVIVTSLADWEIRWQQGLQQLALQQIIALRGVDRHQ